MLPPGSPHNRAWPPPGTTPGRQPGTAQALATSGQGPLPHAHKGPNYVSVTIATDSGGRQRTPTDGLPQATGAGALAVRVCRWLRDEEANASEEN